MYSMDTLIAAAHEVQLSLDRIDHKIVLGTLEEIEHLLQEGKMQPARPAVRWSLITAKNGHYRSLVCCGSGAVFMLDSCTNMLR